MFEFKLGQYAKSKITGFEGTISAVAEHLNSCDRYHLMPKVKEDGTLADGYWFDDVDIEIINDGLKKADTVDFKYELGAEVKSNISGVKGKVTGRMEHFNGCISYWVQPKVVKDNKVPDGMWIDEGEVEVVKAPKKPATPRTRSTGGFHSSIK